MIRRGAADDKRPLVQALLALKALAASGQKRTHTLRLLVGSDEESSNLDFAEYLKDHRAPDFSLVLDSEFPVVVGEKAWNALTVETPMEDRGKLRLFPILGLESGLAPSIVPDQASLRLEDPEGWLQAAPRQRAFRKALDPTFKLEVLPVPGGTEIRVLGKAAHAGVNAAGGRNALVALANLMGETVPADGARDLLAFAQLAGRDLRGTGLGLATADPVFGFPTVVPSLLKAQPDGKVRLTINIRSTPSLSGEALKAHLFKVVADFNARTGAKLEPGGFFGDTPLAFDPRGKLVKRLLASYARATGQAAPPAISGGGTYAKRIPHAIAFGMWFPGKPYPGHDVDEQVSLTDLHRGVHVLLEALADLATGEPLKDPLGP